MQCFGNRQRRAVSVCLEIRSYQRRALALGASTKTGSTEPMFPVRMVTHPYGMKRSTSHFVGSAERLEIVGIFRHTQGCNASLVSSLILSAKPFPSFSA